MIMSNNNSTRIPSPGSSEEDEEYHHHPTAKKLPSNPMARGLTTMEMIYSAVRADFIVTKSLQYVSSDAMVFVYNLTLAGEAPQWGPPIRLTHFGALDKPSHCFLEPIETRSLSINGRTGTNRIETGNICHICAHIILQWKVILMYWSVSIMRCSVKWPPVVWAPQTAT